MYHGPTDEVLTYFAGQGFQCPERKGVADFLQEITSRKDQKVCASSFLPAAASTISRTWYTEPFVCLLACIVSNWAFRMILNLL